VGIYLGMSPTEQLRRVDTTSAARRRAQQSVASVTPQMAQRGAQIARAAPWIEPGALLALMKGTTSMEPVRGLATASAVRRARNNPTNRRPGERVSVGQLDPGNPNFFERFAQWSRPAREQMEVRETQRSGATPLGERSTLSHGERALRAEAEEMRPQLEAEQAYFGGLRAEGFLDPQNNLRSPFYVRGEYSPEEAAGRGVDAVRSQRFIEILNELAGEGKPVPFIDMDGKEALWDPQRQKLAPQSLYEEAPPYTVGDLVSTLKRTFEPVGAYWAQYGFPRGPTGYGSAHKPRTAGLARPADPADVFRESTMLLEAPVREAEGLVRNAYGEATGRDVDWWEAQSDYLISMTETDMDAGQGYLVDPDSELAQERRRREAERGQIYGENITLGRLAAGGLARMGVINPGDNNYRVLSGLVDAAKLLYLDPVVLGAGRVAKVNNLRHAFQGGPDIAEGTGLIRGLFSNSVHGPTTGSWLVQRQGEQVVANIAEELNGGELWRRLGRQLRPSELRALRDSTDPAEVQALLEPMLGQQFPFIDKVWQQPSRWLEPIVESRALTDIPAPYFNLSDQDQILWQVERWMRNVHAPEGVQNRFLDEVISANGDDVHTVEALDRMMDWTFENVGWRSPSHRQRVISDWRTEMDDARRWLIDEATDERMLDSITMGGGDDIPLGNPFEAVSNAQFVVQAPEPRELRRLTTALGPLISTKEAKLRAPLPQLLWWQEQIWKPFTLLRAAWTLRVIPEEQLRMAAVGHASMFKDPWSFVVWATTRRKDLMGIPFDEAKRFHDTMSVGTRGWFNERPGLIRTGRQVRVNKGEDRFLEAAATNLVALHNDDIARQVAMSDNLDDVENWLNGEGAGVWANFMDEHPSLANEPGLQRAYLEMVAEHISYKTGGHEDLLGIIRTGQLNGHNVTIQGGLGIDKRLPKGLEGYLDALPDALMGEQIIEFAGRRRRAVEVMFSTLMGWPTDFLSRSPEFRQAYWERVQIGASFLRADAKEDLVAAAREALKVGPFDPKIVKKLEATEAAGDLTMAQLDEVAKGYAVDTVKDLLYDLTKRSQIADSMRLISPFGEAWREVITRWGTLMNPTTARGVKNIRRFQTVLQGAHGEDFGEVMGTPEIWDSTTETWTQPGFFWRDEFGEEVFIYPGSEWVMNRNLRLPDWLPAIGGLGTPGIPVPLSGRVEGLNMVGNVFPGLGPVASIPVSWFMPDKPGWQRTVREWMLPFGAVTEQGSAAILDMVNFAPPWLRTGLQVLLGSGYDYNTNRLYANSTMATANYLYSTGRYDTTTTAGQQKLMDDARQASRNVYLIKALAAFGAPSAPSPEFLVETNQGAIRLAMLRDDYWNMVAEDPRTADERFLERWGDLIADPGKDRVGMTMQSFTREVTGGINTSREWEDWANENRDLQRDYNQVWAFFGPTEGKFNYDVYLRSILAGHREQLTLEDWMALGQHHLGSMQVDAARAEIAESPGDPQEDKDYIASVQEWAFETFPGYSPEGDVPFIESRGSRADKMRQLSKAVEDDRILSTSTGGVLAEYWQERMVSVDYAESIGLGVHGPHYDLSNSKQLVEDRLFLLELGEYLADQDTGFKNLWNRVLRAEVDVPSDLEGSE